MAQGDALGPALREFFGIADRWKLGIEDQMRVLGAGSRSVFYRWRAQGAARASEEVTGRLSDVLAIDRSLRSLLPDERSTDTWLRKSDPALGGRPPLEVMLSGDAGLERVRRYLAAESGAVRREGEEPEG